MEVVGNSFISPSALLRSTISRDQPKSWGAEGVRRWRFGSAVALLGRGGRVRQRTIFLYLDFLFVCLFSVLLFRAIPTAYGSSQAKGQIGATAASLHHSHSNAKSELPLQTRPQLVAMPNP